MILILLSGAWGKVIHEKTCSKKSRDTVPLRYIYMQNYVSVYRGTSCHPFSLVRPSGVLAPAGGEGGHLPDADHRPKRHLLPLLIFYDSGCSPTGHTTALT
jgi:hypothetical protein